MLESLLFLVILALLATVTLGVVYLTWVQWRDSRQRR